jgi:hypothetical protein
VTRYTGSEGFLDLLRRGLGETNGYGKQRDREK